MKKLSKLFIILILIIIFTISTIVFFNKKVLPIYNNYASEEMKRVITTIINKSVNEEITNDLNINSFFIINTNETTKLTIVDFDPVIVNRIMSKIADIVYENMKLMEKQDETFLKKYNISNNIFYIPSGIIFNTVSLNNLGPKIPVKMELISSVNPSIKTEVTEYGINNSLIEVYVHVNVDVKMILPISSSTSQIVVVVPLCVKLIQGEVPKYYQGTSSKSTLFFEENP